MKFYIDLTTRRFVKAPNSSAPLTRVFFKRRDKIDVDVFFVDKSAIAPTPAGTVFTTALKRNFSDDQFLALADGDGTLNLYTAAVESLFPGNTVSSTALLEVKFTRPGEETRTATLAAELQNSVILGDEGTPAAAPELKATAAEAVAGVSNEKWMTPLRTAQAIAELAPPSTWDSITGKPAAFPPSAHTHSASQITDFAASVAAVSPPVDWSSLTGKPSEFSPAPHSHTASQISDFASAVVAVSPPADWSSLTGKPATFAPSTHTHTTSEITGFASAVAAAAPAPTTPANSGISITGTALATAYNTAIDDGVQSVAVGGAPAAPASAWKAKSLVQVLDDILFPTLLASVGTAKSVNLSVSGASGTLEIGSTHSRTLSTTFARGTITNGNGSTNANPLVGAASTYTFTGTGIPSTTQAAADLAFSTAVVSGSNNWAVTVAHAAGTGTYTDNKGVSGTNLDASRAAGTATDTTSSPTITGVHPYYYFKRSTPITAADMVAAIQSGTATKVIAASTGTLSIPYAPAAEFFAVAYPSTSTTKATYFVTALDSGPITVVFQPMTPQSVTTALWTQSYKIHVSASALTNSNATIELRN